MLWIRDRGSTSESSGPLPFILLLCLVSTDFLGSRGGRGIDPEKRNDLLKIIWSLSGKAGAFKF